MRFEGINPDAVAFTAVMHAYALSDQFEQARDASSHRECVLVHMCDVRIAMVELDDDDRAPLELLILESP